MQELQYVSGYPEEIRLQIRHLIEQGKLAAHLLKKYAVPHDVRTDRALYQYVQDLKSTFIRNGEPVSKVAFDSKIHVIRHALGLHTSISRVQGGKLKAKHEISIASIFRTVPIEFLRMIAVHELAHLKEKNHDKAFYKLCTHMEPQYHQYELDLRLYLTHLDHNGSALWSKQNEAAQ